MDNVNNDFLESITGAAIESQQSDFYFHAINSPEPADEDENENDRDENENEDALDESEISTDNDPPLDDDVVHSPLPPQTGGRPE